jgi:hypothetical protein
MLVPPATALAGKPEPGGGGGPGASVTGTDRYGAVTVNIGFGDRGAPQTLGLIYANACSKAGTEIKPEISVSRDGLFAQLRGGYAVSGRVTSTGDSFTVRGSVASSHVCHGATAPVVFTASGRV